jgi:hypothetical protein
MRLRLIEGKVLPDVENVTNALCYPFKTNLYLRKRESD